MKIVSFAGTKGGCGRSTLAYNLAIDAAKTQGVLLADLDPQQSLAELWKRRGDNGNPRLIDNVGTVIELVNRLKRSGFARELLIVDTPGSNMTLLTDAVMAADVVVLPVQPSPMDLLAQGAICDLVETAGKSDRAIFVLNRIDPRSDLAAEAHDWLARNYGFPIAEIRQRPAYARAAIAGKSAGDIDKDAAEEIAALWALIGEKLA